MIRFTDVCFSYGGAQVVDNLSFSCPSGGVVWLTGANGSGKSTALHLALGLLRRDSGRIEASRSPSAVFQEDRLCEHLTAVANVRLAQGPEVSRRRILDELECAGLSPEDAVRPVVDLSGGQRRRVSLVRALMRDSDLLCLDEPFAGIDAVDDAVAYSLSRLANRSILLVCHDPEAAARFAPARILAL